MVLVEHQGKENDFLAEIGDLERKVARLAGKVSDLERINAAISEDKKRLE